MASMILAGSQDNYTPVHPEKFGDTLFEVTQDTCSESEKLPVVFTKTAERSWIPMRRAIFTHLKTSDFQGPSK